MVRTNPLKAIKRGVECINPSDLISFNLFLLLPVILPFVRRAGPPILVATGLFAAFWLWREGKLKGVLNSHLRNPVTLLFLAFMCWATITLAWSPWPQRGLASIAICSSLVISFLMVSEFSLSGQFRKFLGIGLSIGCTIILIDISSGAHLLRIIHGSEPNLWQYNIVAVIYCVMGIAFAGRKYFFTSPTVLVTLILLYISTLLGSSETAKLVLLLSPILYLFAHVVPNVALRSISFCVFFLLFLFASAGFPGLAAVKIIIPTSFWVDANADHRIAIWSSFADFSLHGLPYGWGIDATAASNRTAYFLAATQEVQAGISRWHPHNNILQISAELGVPGLIFAFAILIGVISRNLSTADQRNRGFIVFISAIFVIACISHGFWQSWWWTTVLIGYLAISGRIENEELSLS